MVSKLYDILKTLLLSVDAFRTQDNELNIPEIQRQGYEASALLVSTLTSKDETRQAFFIEHEGLAIYNRDKFIEFVSNKNFLANSYTKYSNKIGLTIDNKFIKANTDVVLSFPFKDCVLEGGQTKEETKQNEVFFNEVLAQEEIDRLFDKKVLCKGKRFSQEGISTSPDDLILKRDKNGIIQDNLIIKGNNLIALHSIKAQFAGKVKLIYIDPPYNTGNDGFKYNDNFTHSTWLTFMKNRLEIARKMLRDDGVVFVQCDDNEQAYLKVLMDEVFGRENFDSCVSVVVKTEGRRYGNLAKTHEFILVYAKDVYSLEMFELYVKDKKFAYEDEISGFDLKELRNQNSQAFHSINRPNLRYPFFVSIDEIDKDSLMTISLEKKDGYIEVYPITIGNNESVWRWGKEKSQKEIIQNLVARKGKDEIIRIFQKYRSKTSMPKTTWQEKEFISNKATKEIKNLFSSHIFNYPKPEALIQRIIEISTQPNDLVLDFHLGSGTTAAVAHKMGRQYIGIEQMDYVETIAVERLKKVIGTMVQKDGELAPRLEYDQGGISKAVEWQGGGEFVYLALKDNTAGIVQEIANCTSKEALAKIKQSLDQYYIFIDYRVRLDLLKDQEFDALALDEQKKILIRIFDKNQLYVPYSERSDAMFSLSQEDIALSESFYEGDTQ